MKFGEMSVPDDVGKLKYSEFLVYFDKVLKHRTKIKPLTMYKKLGGKVPKKKDEGGD